MHRILVLALISAAAFAQQDSDSPTGPRITPPTISAVSPLGVSRGATVEMTIEGFNLAKTSGVFFSEPGIKARIVRIKELPDAADVRLGSNGTLSTVDLGPLPPRNQVTLELDVSPEADIGILSMRLQTPLGTSPEARFAIEPYFGESPDREPNDTPETAFETYTPTILVGTISKPGDVDYFKIDVKAGDELVFEDAAGMLGSALTPVVGIYAADQSLVREIASDTARQAGAFSHKFGKAGTYYLRVSDYQQSGSAAHFYRIKVGRLPVAISAYPLGVRQGTSARVALRGFNLGSGKVDVKGQPSSEDERAVIFRPDAPSGHAFSKVKLALGNDPEVESSGSAMLKAAQAVTLPVTINGRLEKPANYFRFKAKKGEKVVLEVAANRLGSPLDSTIEVQDASGKPVERATVRCLIETSTVLRDHDSVQPGIRIQSPLGLAVGDFVMIDGEIMEIDAMPRTPDDDLKFVAFNGQRQAMFDTTSEAHANDSRVFKVQVHPAAAQFASNGLPTVRLAYRNDDGGPGYGKDSRLNFTAPADSEYFVKLSDVRALAGEEFAYRLAMHAPAPDFQLTVTPRNPNVPAGGRIPLTVTAMRMDGFNGPIDVEVLHLAAGLHAAKGVIASGQVSTTLLLSADENAKAARSVPLDIKGSAKIGGQMAMRAASPGDRLKLISITPRADIFMTAITREVTLEPGGTAEVAVSIQRNNQFGGRVPVEIRNLPPGVRVLDVGLNGVLLNENEQTRTFRLEALPSAPAVEQTVYVSGNVETRAGGTQQNAFAGEPILLRVKSKLQVSGGMAPSVFSQPSAVK